jgi:carnitine-CoA ligase
MRPPLQVLSLYPPHGGSLSGLLAGRAAVAPQRECLVFGEQVLTYAQVAAECERAAGVYAALGGRAGHRVGVMSANHPSTVPTLLALARLGAVMVPVNPDYRAAEAGYVLGHAGVSGVLCSPEALPTVREAVASIAPAPWLLLNAADAANPALPMFDVQRAEASVAAPPDAGDPDRPASSSTPPAPPASPRA